MSMLVSIAALRAGRDPKSMKLDFPWWATISFSLNHISMCARSCLQGLHDLFAQMHTLISVNKNSLLSLQYLLPKTVVSWSFFEGLFRVSQFFPQSLNVGRDLKHFLYQPVLYTVSAKLYVLQSRLRNHRWSLLISKIALLSISVLWNGGGGGGRRNGIRASSVL